MKLAEDAQAEIFRLAKINDGFLKAETVVKVARSPKSPLHNYFEWDDSVAANEYRIEQARRMIQNVEIILPEQAEPIRAFVSLSMDRVQDGGGYRPLQEVLAVSHLREVLLADARRDMERFVAKYSRLEELSHLIGSMKEVLKAKLPEEQLSNAAQPA